jgi:DinB family protein
MSKMNKFIITRPEDKEIPEYYRSYVKLTANADLIDELNESLINTINLFSAMPSDKENHRYADGKWTVKEVFIHLTDAERVMQYRALRFARKDSTSLHGFEQNDYVPNSGAAGRSMKSIIDEYKSVRNSTIEQFKNMEPGMLDFKGKANNVMLTPRILGWIIAGHNIHHCNTIRERYL